MSTENSAETQEDHDAYLDQELARLPSFSVLQQATAPAPKLSLRAAFDAKLAADKARAKELDAKANVARRERKALATAAGLRDRKARNKREQRKRDRDAQGQPSAEAVAALRELALAPALIDPQILEGEALSLAAWLATAGRSQGGLRRVELDRPGDLMTSRKVYLGLIAEFGMIPSWQAFADRLTQATGRRWTREQARHRHAKFEVLEAANGPWRAR